MRLDRSARPPLIAPAVLGGVILAGGLQAQPPAFALANVNGTTLYYEVTGNGHPLVLIHGGGVDRRVWDGQIVEFSARNRVIRYDLRGAGRSGPAHGTFSNTDDLHALLQFLKVEKAYIVGLSRGGGVASDFALEYPSMVDGLVLVSANLADVPAVYRRMMISAAEARRDGDLARAVEIWLDDPYQGPGRHDMAARARVRQILEDNLPGFLPRFLAPGGPHTSGERPGGTRIQRLAELRVPTLVIGGESDAPDARANYDRWATGIRAAKKAIIAGAAHLVNIDRPLEFNRIVLDFLGALEKRRADGWPVSLERTLGNLPPDPTRRPAGVFRLTSPNVTRGEASSWLNQN